MKVSQRNLRALVVSLLLAAASLAQVLTSASAQDKLPAPTSNVNDFAEVIDAATKQRLDTVLQNLKAKSDVDLVIAVVKSTGGEDMYDYSLRMANDWKIGAHASPRKSVLMVIAADTGQFFAQFSRAAQGALPDGLVGEMGRRMRARFDARDFGGGLVTGVETFVNGLGERQNFTFAQLDVASADVAVVQTRPRTVENAPTPTDSPTPIPESPSPQISSSPTPAPSPSNSPVAEPTASVETNATPAETPSATAQPTETPAAAPTASMSPVETPVERALRPGRRPNPLARRQRVT